MPIHRTDARNLLLVVYGSCILTINYPQNRVQQIFSLSNLPLTFLIRILWLFPQQNRPLNSQNAADALQKFNLKKTAVQKALDMLADSGQISFKEYGKQKIYIARQDQFNIPNGQELDQMKKDNAQLQEQLEDQKRTIQETEAGNLLGHLCLVFGCNFYSLVNKNMHTYFSALLKIPNRNCHQISNISFQNNLVIVCTNLDLCFLIQKFEFCSQTWLWKKYMLKRLNCKLKSVLWISILHYYSIFIYHIM